MFGHLFGVPVMAKRQLNDGQPVDAGRAAARVVRRAGTVLLLTGFVAACSTAPDWARPSLIYGDDAAVSAAAPSEDKDFPRLADVPEKPTGVTSAEERRQVSDGLAADRERARYTDEVLRGGTETPAQAPRSANPAPAPVIAAIPAPGAPAGTLNTRNSEDNLVIPLPARGGRPLPGREVATTQADVPQTRASTTTEVEVVPVETPAPVAPVSSVSTPVAAENPAPVAVERPRVASTPPAQAATRRAAVPALPEGEGRVRSEVNRTLVDERVGAVDAAVAAVQSTPPVVTPPAATATTAIAAPGGPLDSRLGSRPGDRFERSSAPSLSNEALEAAGPVVSSRYGAPSGAAALEAVTGAADPADPVQVNMDALLSLPGPGASLAPPNGAGGVLAIYANQGGPGNIPPYVVNFGHGSVELAASDFQIIAQAAKAAVELGGIIRIVGHSSSRTGDLNLAKHLLANFKVSLDRATAVANALIGSGVDPARVFVEAKGDAVPVYYESMPAGEAGNRRAEIFIE